MHQVLYVDIDEEMIAVIGRLRRSSSRENALVIPKRALVLQSIVNLRLLQREAEKLGKSILVVTQDEQGRMLAEKAGIAAQAALEEASPQSSVTAAEPHVRIPEPVAAEPAVAKAGFGEEKIQDLHLPRAEAVGSASFFSAFAGQRADAERPVQATASSRPSEPKKIVVRDRSPRNLTALNSQVTAEREAAQAVQGAAATRRPTEDIRTGSAFPAQKSALPNLAAPSFAPMPSETRAASTFAPPAPSHSAAQSASAVPKFSKLPSYFQSGKESGRAPEKKTVQEAVSPKIPGSRKLKGMFFFFAFVSLLSLGGVAAYLFLPKAEVRVKLKQITQKTDMEFRGGEEVSFQDRRIPVRLIEKEGELSASFEATGTSSLADQKARGTVVIYNEYSAEPQTLVASTRLLSQDGKLFRLVSGVTVPGMSESDGKSEPGAIEAAVIADQPGAEYNIGPSAFTVPGFQGSPKHAKFSAKSVKIMAGGGTGGSDAAAVSEEDVRQAKKETEARIAEEARRLLEAEIGAGAKLLPEAVEETVLSSSASPQAGAVADAFEYRVRFKARALVFSEEELKGALSEMFEKQNEGKQPSLFVKDVDLEYGEPTPDFSAKDLRIKVHAVAVLEPKLDISRFKSDILGKGEEGIAAVLQQYPQVDKISVNFWPEFLTDKVSSESGRVTVILEEPESDRK
jgi:hypothetical protein